MHVQHSWCTHQHTVIAIESIPWWRGLLYACYSVLLFLLDLALEGVVEEVLQRPCRLAREPGWISYLLSMCWEI